MAQENKLLEDCPFPHVAESLRPYIKTRQEVESIRSGFQEILPVSFVQIACPDNKLNLGASNVAGVRKAYFKALEAHRQAQSTYENLRSELAQIITSNASDNSIAKEDDTSLTEDYIPLLRQREKHRQLRTIENAYSKICATGGQIANESFDKIIRKEVGEAPVPPTASLMDREAGSDSEYELLRLKKAILATKQQIEDNERAVAEVDSPPEDVIDPQADLKALQMTHNELTTWMEQQLALISGVDGSNDRHASSTSDAQSNGHSLDPNRDIQGLYEQYLDARRRLLASVARPTVPRLSPDYSSKTHRRSSDQAESEQRSAISETVLPFLPDLVAAKQLEQSLLQQGAFTRQQLASAEAQTQVVLARLADESHLVQPDLSRGAPQGRDWKEAARIASKGTTTFIDQRLKSGQAFVETATQTLQAMEKLPSSLDHLLDKT